MPSKPKNDQKTALKLKKKNDQNTDETLKKITKISPKPKKWLKYPWKLEITNTPKNKNKDYNTL